MHIASIVEKVDGKYIARVIGEPTLRGEGDTRQCAINELETLFAVKMASGELAIVDVKPQGIMAAMGAFHDDPDLKPMVEQIYKWRDEEKTREFPE